MSSFEESRKASEVQPDADETSSIAAAASEQDLMNEVRAEEAGESRFETSDAVQRTDGSEAVKGERGIPSVNRERSIHARVSNALALGVMVVLGLAFLGWYYSTVLKRHTDEDRHVRDALASKAAGETKLPPLARIDPPRQQIAVTTLQTGDDSLIQTRAPDTRSAQAMVARMDTESTLGTQPVPQRGPSADEIATLRQLNSPVMYRPAATAGVAPSNGMTPPTAGQAPESQPSGSTPVLLGAGQPSGTGGASASLGGLLQATPTPAVQAQMLPTKRLLMPKGAFIDCTLETALNSQLPGMTTCITATDIFGADGQVVLLERGSKLVGETRGETRLGQGRVFVLWTEARTPTGVVVQLASPGTDELGRSGLPGYVDTHFWDRFGAAILISVIDGTIQAAVAAQNHGSGGSAVVYNTQGSRDVMTEVLRDTVNIPPTVVKNQGERIQVFVARDLDFRSVYSLGSRAIQ